VSSKTLLLKTQINMIKIITATYLLILTHGTPDVFNLFHTSAIGNYKITDNITSFTANTPANDYEYGFPNRMIVINLSRVGSNAEAIAKKELSKQSQFLFGRVDNDWVNKESEEMTILINEFK
jgi:hypothetical protein